MFNIIHGIIHYNGWKAAVITPTMPVHVRLEFENELAKHTSVGDAERLKQEFEEYREEIRAKADDVETSLEAV